MLLRGKLHWFYSSACVVNRWFFCEVISPGSIPRTHGNQIKTDRIDAGKLAQHYAAGLLSVVPVPDETLEKDRDLLRSREFMLRKLSEVRTHIQSLLKRNGGQFKAETANKSHWTKHHFYWLERVIEESTGSLKLNLSLLVQQMKWLEHTIKEYNHAINELAESDSYQKKCKLLRATEE